MEISAFGNIQDWGDSRLKISIFGAIWGHMVPLGPYGAVGAVGAIGAVGPMVRCRCTMGACGPAVIAYSKRSSLRNQPLETQCWISAQFLSSS